MLRRHQCPPRSYRKPIVPRTLALVLATAMWTGLAGAQTCGPPTVGYSGCTTVASTVICYKAVLPTQGCNPAVMVGALGTSGGYTAGGTPAVGYLACYRFTFVTGPGFCRVTGCACGTLTIDNSDGLPVELMAFSVE